MQISIDATPELHNQIRYASKEDIYSKIENTIKKLESKNISYNIATTVNIHNYNNVKLLSNKIVEYKKMKYWKVSPQLPFGCGLIEDTISIDKWNELDNSEYYKKRLNPIVAI